MLFKKIRLGKKGRPPLHPEREVNEVEKEVKQWAKQQAQKDDPKNLPDGRDDSVEISSAEISNAENSNIEGLYISWEADDSTHVSYDCFDGALKRLTPAGPVIRVHPMSTFSISHDSSFGGEEEDQKRIQEAKRLQELGRESPIPEPPSFEAKKEHSPTDTPAANSKTDIKWKDIEEEDEPAYGDKLESVSGMEPGLEITMGDSDDSWHFFVHEASDQSIDKVEEEVNGMFHFCCAAPDVANASLDQRSTGSKSESDDGIKKKGEENDVASKTGTQDVKKESDDGIGKKDIEEGGEEGAGFFGDKICCGVASDEDSGTTNSITSSLKSGSHKTNPHESGEGSVETQNEKVSVDKSKELTEPRCKNEHEKDTGGCKFCNHLQNESSSQVHKDSTVESKIVKKDEESKVLFGLFDAIFSPFFQSGTDVKQKQDLEQSNDKDCTAKTEDVVLLDEGAAAVVAAISAAEDEDAAVVKTAVSAAAEPCKGLFEFLCGASVDKEVGCFVDGISCSGEEAAALKAAVSTALKAGKGLFGLLCGASVDKEVGCFVDGILCGGATAVDKDSNKAINLQDSKESKASGVACLLDWILCEGNKLSSSTPIDKKGGKDLQESKEKDITLQESKSEKKDKDLQESKEKDNTLQESKSEKKGDDLQESKEKDSTLQESKSEKKGKEAAQIQNVDEEEKDLKTSKESNDIVVPPKPTPKKSREDTIKRKIDQNLDTEEKDLKKSKESNGIVVPPKPMPKKSRENTITKSNGDKDLKKPKESEDVVVPRKPTPKESREGTIKRKSDRQDMSEDRTPPPRIQNHGREEDHHKTGKDTSVFKRVSSGYIKQAGYRRVGSIEEPKSGRSLWDGISQNMEDPLKILTFL